MMPSLLVDDHLNGNFCFVVTSLVHMSCILSGTRTREESIHMTAIDFWETGQYIMPTKKIDSILFDSQDQRDQ